MRLHIFIALVFIFLLRVVSVSHKENDSVYGFVIDDEASNNSRNRGPRIHEKFFKSNSSVPFDFFPRCLKNAKMRAEEVRQNRPMSEKKLKEIYVECIRAFKQLSSKE